MKTTRLPLVAAAVVLWPGILLSASPGILMLPDSGELQPGSTREFRFPAPMVAAADLGPAKDPPVVFSPELPGTFTWLSTRSGVFSPGGPLPLGASWEVRLRDGLKAADGSTVPPDFQARLTTPAFGVTATENGVWDEDNVPPDVRVRLAFHLPVGADPKFFKFVDAAGREVAADVRYANDDDQFSVPPDGEDWNLRWQLVRDPAAEPPEGNDGALPARLVVTPRQPLPSGPGWKLVVDAGLPSQDGRHKLATPHEVALGKVAPFVLKTTEAGNYINSGPTLHLEFSDGLAPDITDETAGKFFTISPTPPDLVWEASYETATARGKFVLGQDYKLTIGSDVYSAEGQPFEGSRDLTVRFAPVLPRLYLPELTMAQISGGRRVMPVRSVNLRSIRVRALLIPPEQAARALSVFKEHEWKYSDGNPVPSADLAGRVLCDETIELPGAAIDGRQTTDIDWTKLLGGRKAGTILLELQGEPLPGAPVQTPAAQALIQLTDLGILWKKAGANVHAHVFSTTTGQPVAAASARLLDEKFKVLAKGQTGAKGDTALAYKAAPKWLAVSHGEDSCVLAMGPSAETLRIGEWFSSNWSPDAAGTADMRAMIFTDRPLYQPGETARLKGFVRRFGPDGPAFVPGREVTLVLRNPEFNEVSRTAATTDARGAFDTEFAVPSGPLGDYNLQLEIAGAGTVASASFAVAEYQPDAFEVAIDMPAQFAAGAGAPRATLSARYFFGAPVTDADVRWTLSYFRQPFAPPGFDNFQFIAEDEEETKPLTVRGEGRIASAKPVDIAPVLPAPSLAPYRGVLTAEVTDINQQTVSREAEFTREASDFYLGIARPAENVVRAGTEVPLRVIAVRPDAKPFEDAVDISVSIKRWRYNVVRVLGAGGAMTFRRDRLEEPLLDEKARTVPAVESDGVWTAGEAESLRFKTSAPGHHQIRVTARDREGREVATESSFYVSGDGETVWDYRNPQEITLVPDKKSYLPGETARVLVQTPIEGEAMVSIEQGSSILREMRVPLAGNAPVIEVPLDDACAPNVTVALVIVRGADESKRKFPAPEFRYGSCSLAVEQPAALLRVDVAPEKTKVQPGEEVRTTIKVVDNSGQPVAGAGVTFYAVDDGILALTGFKRPDPAAVFLAPVATRVLTGLSLAQLLPEDPEDLRFSNKGFLIGGGGEEGPLALRENFPGTACWMPSLVTDENGSVTASFTAPDALTRYRLVAVAVSGPAAYGSAESSVSIARPLMLLPALGQFINTGDKITARAVVRNETGRDGTVEVALQTHAGTVKTTLDVPHGGSRAAEFPLAFNEPGTADLEWSATMQAAGTTFTDRVKTALPVRSPMLQLRETYFTALDKPANDLLDGVNPQLVEGRGEAAVTLANSRLAAAGEQARFLAAYPYGCVEQTASTLVPWLMMPALGPFLPDFARSPEEIKRVTDETAAKLLEFQAPDGGLAFWPGGATSNTFASAWAAIVLARAEQQGTKLPQEWTKLLDYLAGSLRGLTPEEGSDKLADRAFAAYALASADRAEASYHEELYRRRTELPADARAVLALAILQSDGPREMAADLLGDESSAPGDVSPFGGAARDRAIRLMAWSAFDPKNREVPRLLAEVLAFGPQNRAGTTQSCAWTLLALAEYRARVEQPAAAKRAVQGKLVAGSENFPFVLDKKQPAFRKDIALPVSGGEQVLRVDNPSSSALYGETRFVVTPPLGEQPRQDRGFSVSRSYRKIAADGSLQPADDLRVGDRVVVTLRLETTRPAHFVAIDDPLPSILEAVNPAFVSRGVGGTQDTTPWLVSHREVRSDRVLYFCDALPPGSFTFEYLARVRMAGEVTAGATKAEAMYRPERFGLGEIGRLTSRPAASP